MSRRRGPRAAARQVPMTAALLAAALLHLGAIAALLAWPDRRPVPEPPQGAVLIWAEPAVAAAGAPAAEPSPPASAPEPPVSEPPAPEPPTPEPVPPVAPAPSPDLPLPPPPAPEAPPAPPRPAARSAPAPRPAAGPAPPAESAWAAEGATTPPGPLAGHRNADPTYPRYAQALGQQGSVRLRLTVGADGRVAGAAVDRGSGFSNLDAAAVEAALRWRFRPAQRAGRPVVAEAFTTVTFQLDGVRPGA